MSFSQASQTHMISQQKQHIAEKKDLIGFLQLALLVVRGAMSDWLNICWSQFRKKEHVCYRIC